MQNDIGSNSYLKYLLLLVLPVILFLSATALKDVQGPYYMFFYDPSYVYLINSLNLAQMSGYGVGHFDHPGTTVQVTGAAAVRICHLISSGGSDIVTDVLSRPESYLFFMNRVFITLNCIMLFALGLFVCRITCSLFPALLLQLTPFVSTEIFFGLIIVTPENFLIFVCLLFICAAVYYLYTDSMSRSRMIMFLVSFSFICGLGLATKISFFPLMILPLMIFHGLKRKIVFLVATCLFFLIFISPGLSNLEYFINWVGGLVMKSGKYGKGEATVINSSAFYANIKHIFSKDIVYTVSFIASVVAASVMLVAKPERGTRMHRMKLLLLSLCFIFLLQTLIVAKHYAQYYMIPSFMLAVPSLLLSLTELTGFYRKSQKATAAVAFAVAGTFIFAWSMYQVVSSYKEGNAQREDAVSMLQTIEDLRTEAMLVSSFGSSGSETALAFASQYGASQSRRYQAILAGKFRSKVFYNQWTDQFFTVSDMSSLKASLLKGPGLLLQLSHYGNLESFLASLKRECGVNEVSHEKIFSNEKKETLYRVWIN